jgi:AcrR family transcriptional regulator
MPARTKRPPPRETPKKETTRDRILVTCRDLFNARGPGDVTTAEIAAKVGINEGNLYYYFQRKEQILEALFQAFETALETAATADLSYAGDATRYREYLGGWFALMWEWRFIYRDGLAVCRLAPSLRKRVVALSDSSQAQVRRALNEMVHAGLIKARPKQLDRLNVNAWIIATYWIDYLRLRHGSGKITRKQLDWGATQVMSLYEPYLTEKGRMLVGSG